MIRTLIADRMALIRVGLVACISREPDIEVVAELDRREPVLPTVAALRPDVAVIDDGIAAADKFLDAPDSDVPPALHRLVLEGQAGVKRSLRARRFDAGEAQ